MHFRLFVESVMGPRNKDLGTGSQTLLTEDKLRLRLRLLCSRKRQKPQRLRKNAKKAVCYQTTMKGLNIAGGDDGEEIL